LPGQLFDFYRDLKVHQATGGIEMAAGRPPSHPGSSAPFACTRSRQPSSPRARSQDITLFPGPRKENQFSMVQMMKSYFVDSFTNEAFKGNPAGVCFLEHELESEVMLKIAQEFGFSEIAFIQKTNKPGTYTIRYFSPIKEIPLCGHATLASAKVIFRDTDINEIHFITSENLQLAVGKHGEEIMMEFPVYDTIAATISPATLAALGLTKVINTVYS
jgi:Phenazine biosynthesis-like protein